MVDIRRERAYIDRKGYKFIQDVVGEAVLWLEYDALHSASHHVYDEPTEGATRAWKPPILVPALWVNETEGARENSADGRMVTNTLRLAVSVSTLTAVGLSGPTDSRRHINDMLVYRRNYWRVDDYQIRGRLRKSIIVGITATQVLVDDDMPFDVLPSIDGLLSTVRPMGFPTDGYANQTFNEHDLTAHHDS